MIDLISTTLGSFPILKSLIVLIIVAALVAILSLAVNAIAYIALAQDDLDKPLFKITGLLDKVFGFLKVPTIYFNGNTESEYTYHYTWNNLIPFISKRVFVNHGGAYYHLFLDSDGRISRTDSHHHAFERLIPLTNPEVTKGISLWYLLGLLIRALLLGVAADLSLLAFSYSPVATLSVLGTLATLYSTRFISKKLWKVTAKTDNHEDRIKELEDA